MLNIIMNNTLSYLTARAAQVPENEDARITRLAATGGDRFGVIFNDNESQELIWTIPQIPTAYQGTGTLYLDIHCAMDEATSGTVGLNAYLEAGDVNISSTSFDSVNTNGDTVAGTAGDMFVITITLTNKDFMAAGDTVRIKLNRNLTSYTATGDLYVLGGLLYETVTSVTLGGALVVTSLTSSVSTGTAPFTVSSTTVVSNLNVDKLDGYDATDFVLSGDEDTNAVILVPTSSSRNIIQPSAAGYIPLTIKGYTSQTANLTEWQDSSGTALSSVSAAGLISGLSFTSTQTTGTAPLVVASTTVVTNLNADTVDGLDATAFPILLPTSSSRNVIQPSAAGYIPLTIKGYTSQTANLTEWQDSNAYKQLAISSAGFLSFYENSGTNRIGQFVPNSSDGQLAYVIENASYPGFAIKGTTSQTGNLQEWQDSSETVLSSVSSSGIISAPRFISTTSTGTAPFTISSTTVVTNLNADTVDGLEATAFPILAPASSVRNVIQPTAATYIPLTIKGYTSQSANLTEWQNSSGTVVTSVNSAGSLHILPAASTSVGTPAFKIAETGVSSLIRYYGGLFEFNGATAYFADAGGLNRIQISSSISGMKLDVNHKIFFGNTYLSEDFNIALTKGNHGLFSITDYASKKGAIVCGSFGGSTPAQTIVGAANTNKLITNVALTSNVATITTSGPHTFQTGQKVVISSLTNSGLNGTYIITNIPSTTTFKYDKVASNITSVADSGYATQTQTADLTQWKSGGSGAKFVAASSQSLSYDTTSLNADADMTISMWINPIAATTGDLFFVGTTNVFDGFRVYYDSTNNRINVNRTTTTNYAVSATSSIPSGCWTHVVVTYIASSGLTQVYINGVASGTSGSNVVSVGTKGYKLGYSGSAYYSGGMDAVGIWNKALTTSDITSLFSLCKSYADLNSSETTSLHAWYDFATSGTILTDSSGNNRTLTNTGVVTADEGIPITTTKISSSGRLVIGAATNGATIDVTGTDGTRFLNIADGYGTVYIQYGQVVANSFYGGGTSLFGSASIGANADITLTRSSAGVLQIKDASTGNGSLICGAYSASTVGLTVKGYTSQTAKIQEWQDSSSTVKAAVTKDGFINIGGTIVGTHVLLKCTTGAQFEVRHADDSNPCNVFLGGGIFINTTSTGLQLGSTWQLHFCSGANPTSTGQDSGIGRSAAGILKITNGSSGYGSLIVGAYSAATVGLTVAGYTSQSANLQNWTDSSSTVLAKVTSGGAVAIHGTSSLDYTTTTAGLYLGYQGSVAPTILFANGTASQNIRVDMVSGALRGTIAGTALFNMDANTCLFTTSYLKSTNNVQALGNLSAQKIASSTYNALQSTAQLYLDGFNGTGYGGTATADGYGIWDAVRMTDNGGTVRTAHSNEYYVATAAAASWKAKVVKKVGDVSSQREYLRAESDGTYGLTSIGGASIITSSTLSVISPTATYVGLTVKGASSQSANLQEWQNSSGTILTKINSAGDIIWGNRTGFIGGATWGLTFSYSSGYLQGYFNFGKYKFSNIFTVSQAMNWSSDAFNVAADVGVERSAAGILKFTDASTGNGSLICGAYSAATVGLTVKGATSQSANLTEWQNSSATVLAKVNKNGVITGATRQTFTSSSNACTYNYDVSRSQSIVLTESTTLTISNPVDGIPGVLFIEQGGSGSYTVTWPANVLWSGGTSPTLTTTVGKIDMITFVYHTTNDKYYATAALNF